MDTIFEKIIGLLEAAKESAMLKNSSFGFPNDRIEVKSVHFGSDYKGRTGDVMHPDQYIKKIVALHHKTWIVTPIDSAIALLRLHAETLQKSNEIIEALERLDVRGVLSRARAGIKE